jgi:phospholipase/lecithinase/hemolysin
VPVGNIVGEIEALAAKGAETFLIPNLPDLDALPVTLLLDPVTRGGLNFLTGAHNAILAGALHNLQLAHPRATFYLMDVNTLVRSARANPAAYDLTNVSDRAILVSPAAAVGYLFWDDVHPTRTAHGLLANFALETIAPSLKHHGDDDDEGDE